MKNYLFDGEKGRFVKIQGVPKWCRENRVVTYSDFRTWLEVPAMAVSEGGFGR
jgi:hypothetical protein